MAFFKPYEQQPNPANAGRAGRSESSPARRRDRRELLQKPDLRKLRRSHSGEGDERSGSLQSLHSGGDRKEKPGRAMQRLRRDFHAQKQCRVVEETRRILSESLPRPSCPDPLYSNHRVPVGTSGAFVSIGKTKLGSARYRCKACGGGFSVKPPGLNPIRNQRQSDKNRSILSMLTNKMPLRRICEAADLSPRVLYERIDSFHEQALAFLADRERNLSTTAFPRLYVGVDRQMYAINWSGREDKRNVVLEAEASAENGTGYVFGMYSNFDPAPNPKVVEQAALAAGSSAGSAPSSFRQALAPVRLRRGRQGVSEADAPRWGGRRDPYGLRERRSARRFGVVGHAVERRQAAGERNAGAFPVHAQRALHGSLEAAGRGREGAVLPGSGIRGDCIGAFVDRILDDRCEAFYVRIAKELTVDEKRKLIKEAAEAFEHSVPTVGSVKTFVPKYYRYSKCRAG